MVSDIHLIKNRLSSELLHCALRIVAYPDRKAPISGAEISVVLSERNFCAKLRN